ncbi:MAG: alpha/beta hydrolase [Bacteroidota bacterium]|nr:alpha/beta hydrolase [Bacteroidota bacterium]
MQKITTYIFSGLGVDERVFKRIHFPENVEVHFVKWKQPVRYNENIDDYISRLTEIKKDQPVVLIGLSFGGIIAQEVAAKINPAMTIIISSLSSSKELPWYFKLFGRLYLDRITPFRFFKFPNFITNRIFGAKTREDKNLLQQIVRESDNKIVRWSVRQVLGWKSKPGISVFHIHGTKDRLLPLKNKNVNVKIEGGGHFMVFNKAKEIEIILRNALSKI